MTFHAVSLVVGRSAGWSVNLCIDCVRPLFELRPPGSSLACNSPPFSPEEKNLCPPSLQTTPLPAKYAALSQLSSPIFLLLFVFRGEREKYIFFTFRCTPLHHFLLWCSIYFLSSLSLSPSIFSIYLFFLPCSSTSRSLFSSIFRTTDFSILRIMRPFCFSLSSRKQVTNDSAFTCFECNKSFVSTCGHLQRPADGGAAVVYSFIDSA